MERRGFTLIEMMVGCAVASLLIAGVFLLARTQIQTYTHSNEVGKMQTASRFVFEAITKDIRNAGAGTSFYAGIQTGSFGGQQHVTDGSDGSSRGLPGIRIANNVAGGSVMPGSDAIALLRIVSGATFTEEHIPCDPGVGNPFQVTDWTPLSACANANGLVLISDNTRPTGEPESTILSLDGAASNAAQALIFNAGYGINPAAASRCTDRSVSPRGFSMGSRLVCVQPVTYWLDNQTRLRLFQATATSFVGSTMISGGGYAGRVPINPVADAILAEGIEDLQFAVLMSSEAGGALSNAWAFNGLIPPNEELLAEARVVRATVLTRTGRVLKQSDGPARIAQIEDHALPATKTYGCANPAACYDPSYRRKALVFNAEIRNMRLFDMLSDSSRTTNLIRSYRE